MQSHYKRVLFALLLLTATIQADVTVRYKYQMKLSPVLPGQGPMAVFQSMPADMDIRVKGSLAYSTFGALTCIMDAAKQQITLIDTTNKHFATVPLSGYTQALADTVKMPEMPAAVKQIFEGMKISMDHKSTGRTEVIQGIQAEETEYDISMEIPMPSGPPSDTASGSPAVPAAMQMRMVMTFWAAKQDEVVRTPAVHELAGFMSFITQLMNPAGMMQQFTKMMPGFSDKFEPMMKEMMAQPRVLLRTYIAIYMPMLANLAAAMEKMGKPVPVDFDPNGPMMEQGSEAIELSTTSVDEAIFRIPEGFSSAPLAEVLRSIMPGVPSPKQ